MTTTKREQPQHTLTPEQLAERLGVDVQLVHKWRAQKHLPQLTAYDADDGGHLLLWPAAIEDRARHIVRAEAFVEWAKRDPVGAGRYLDGMPPAVELPEQRPLVEEGDLVVGVHPAPSPPEFVAGRAMHRRAR